MSDIVSGLVGEIIVDRAKTVRVKAALTKTALLFKMFALLPFCVRTELFILRSNFQQSFASSVFNSK